MEGTKLELPPSHQHPAHGRCLVNISRLNVQKCQQLQRLLTGAGKNQELTSATAQKEAREDGWTDVRNLKSSCQDMVRPVCEALDRALLRKSSLFKNQRQVTGHQRDTCPPLRWQFELSTGPHQKPHPHQLQCELVSEDQVAN